MNIFEGGDNLNLRGDDLNFEKEVRYTFSESDARQKKLGISIFSGFRNNLIFRLVSIVVNGKNKFKIYHLRISVLLCKSKKDANKEQVIKREKQLYQMVMICTRNKRRT